MIKCAYWKSRRCYCQWKKPLIVFVGSLGWNFVLYLLFKKARSKAARNKWYTSESPISSLVGRVRNILPTWWIVPINRNPWRCEKLWSCSGGSSWRSNVWSFMVWSRWPVRLGYFTSWCWIYFWPGNSSLYHQGCASLSLPGFFSLVLFSFDLFQVIMVKLPLKFVLYNFVYLV